MDAFEKLTSNEVYKAEITKPRNYKFHKKAFALIQAGFEAWNPEEKIYKGKIVEKNIDRFRDDVTILAGYYSVVFNYKGEMQFKADSWSFSNMDDIKFEEMYSRLIDVMLAKILINYNKQDLEKQVNIILGFC